MTLSERLKEPETAQKCYDALAIYNYTRFPEDLYTEEECDMFAKVVQNAMNLKRLHTLNWEKGAKAGPEDYKKVLTRGSQWGQKNLGKTMLEEYLAMDDVDQKKLFMEGLASSECVLLEAMDELSQYLESGDDLMLEASGSKTPQPPSKEEEEKAQKVKEMEEQAKKEKREKMKKRLKTAGVVAGGVALGALLASDTKHHVDNIKEGKKKQSDTLLKCFDDITRETTMRSSKDFLTSYKKAYETKEGETIYRSFHRSERVLYNNCKNKVSQVAKRIDLNPHDKVKEVEKIGKEYNKGVKALMDKKKRQMSKI